MNTTPDQDQTILVLGATGKTGRRVAARLTGQGHDVRAGSRSAASPFDWQDVATWAPALRGVSAAYLSYYPDLCVPGALETVTAFAGRAVRSGVERLVLLSGRGEPEAQQAEDAVLGSGADATVVRCAWFAQNFSESFLLDGVLEGTIVLPVGDAIEPFVDAEDIADVAVAALTRPGHAGQVYELTGPRCLGFAEVAELLAAATGRSIAFVPVAIEDYVAGLRAAGLPEDAVTLYRYLLTETMDGRNESVADGVRRALGREPRTFEDYVRRTAAEGVWASEGVTTPTERIEVG